MSRPVRMRLYDTNILLAREIQPGEPVTLQLWPHYPNVDFAVRIIRDRNYQKSLMPSDYIAFGTDILGFLPPEEAKIVSERLRSWEESLDSALPGDEYEDASCVFREMDAWGAAVVEIGGSIAEGCHETITDYSASVPRPEV